MTDPRWDRIVLPRLHLLVRVIDAQGELLDRLTAMGLVTRDEWERLRLPSTTKIEKARDLLMDVLPRKHRSAYDEFIAALKETKGQQHVVHEILNKPTIKECPDPDTTGEAGMAELKQEMERKRKAYIMKKRENEGRKWIELGLRIKHKDSGWNGKQARWISEPRMCMPVACNPFGCVGSIGGTTTVGWCIVAPTTNGRKLALALTFGVYLNVKEGDTSWGVMTEELKSCLSGKKKPRN
eukprot:m.90545 g.90545  ORF g.90545 m.90545 type:complete len:239 (+) comp36653_c0_seq3:33-749(+)